jgi:hypothetical protein
MTNRKIEYWVIPPNADSEFVASMELVLDTYEKPYDSTHPVLCMDEQPVQLIKETREPIPATRRHAKRVDYEYERAGTASIFMFTEPLAGWREATARPTKTKLDWAIEMARLKEGPYRACPMVTIVCDNLNTHTIGAFHEAFPPARARALVRRLHFCHTPKHGSWLNIAENGAQLSDKAMRIRTTIQHPAEVAIGTVCLVHGCQYEATRCRLADEGQRRPRKTQVPLPENQDVTEQ